MIEGVNKVVIEVVDQDRALQFWTEKVGFSAVQDRYGDERWIEVRTPDKGVVLVLSVRHGATRRPHPTTSPAPTSSSAATTFLGRTRSFRQPPVAQDFGWWSMFEDQEGNRFALRPCEE